MAWVVNMESWGDLEGVGKGGWLRERKDRGRGL
jgi:hypothetical protein